MNIDYRNKVIISVVESVIPNFSVVEQDEIISVILNGAVIRTFYNDVSGLDALYYFIDGILVCHQLKSL